MLWTSTGRRYIQLKQQITVLRSLLLLTNSSFWKRCGAYGECSLFYVLDSRYFVLYCHLRSPLDIEWSLSPVWIQWVKGVSHETGQVSPEITAFAWHISPALFSSNAWIFICVHSGRLGKPECRCALWTLLQPPSKCLSKTWATPTLTHLTSFQQVQRKTGNTPTSRASHMLPYHVKRAHTG